MFWFKKKKEKNKTVEMPQVCNHKYRDFNWYIDATYYNDTEEFNYKIVEPFICIHCGHRKDIVLVEKSKMFDSYENALNEYDKLQEQYKEHLKDRALLEDEIADMQLVDREYLKIIDMLHNSNSKKITLQLEKQ